MKKFYADICYISIRINKYSRLVLKMTIYYKTLSYIPKTQPPFFSIFLLYFACLNNYSSILDNCLWLISFLFMLHTLLPCVKIDSLFCCTIAYTTCFSYEDRGCMYKSIKIIALFSMSLVRNNIATNHFNCCVIATLPFDIDYYGIQYDRVFCNR